MEGLQSLLLLNDTLTPLNVPLSSVPPFLFVFLFGYTGENIQEPPSRKTRQAVFVPAASSGQEITLTSVCLTVPVSNMAYKADTHT